MYQMKVHIGATIDQYEYDRSICAAAAMRLSLRTVTVATYFVFKNAVDVAFGL